MDKMIHTVICSRKDKPPKNFKGLLNFFERLDDSVTVAYDQEGIFQGYSNTVKNLPNARKNDIVILCHDDIQIFNDLDDFRDLLYDELLFTDEKVGFVGVAGAKLLQPQAVWWDPKLRAEGKLRGFVFQGSDPKTMVPNYFGPHGPVVVLDGLFLAARKEVLDHIGLDKPADFDNGWDFYDLEYTLKAYELGYTNKTIPVLLTHYSDGIPRDTWEKNRRCFIKKHRLPVSCP